MGIGSLFSPSSKSLARQSARKTVEIIKKVGTFGIEWPTMPAQRVKDYKVITTASELIAYLKRCEETGLCGFDYETTVSAEFRKVWEAKEQAHREEENELIHKYQDQIHDLEEPDYKKREATLKKLEKERDSVLKSFYTGWDKLVETDFLNSPLDPWKAEICTVSLSAAPHEARVVFIDNQGTNRFKSVGELKSGYLEYNSIVRGEVFNVLNEHLFQNKNIMKIAVNLSFETKQTAKLGMYIMEPVADPFLMWVRCTQVVAPEKILDPKSPASGKGLKPMTKEYFGVEMQDFKALLEKHKVQFFSEISADHPDALNYSAEDSDYAVQHYLYWKEIAKQIPHYDKWLHRIEMPFARVIGLMEYWGMAWDDNLAEQKKQEAEIMRDTAIADIVTLGKNFGLELAPGKTGKTGSVKSFLFDTLGVPVAKRSEKTDGPSLDEEALIDMKFMIENKLEDLDEEEYLAIELPSINTDGVILQPSTKEDYIAILDNLAEYQKTLAKKERKAMDIMMRSDHPHKEDALKLLALIQSVQTYSTLLSSHIVGRQKFLNEMSGRIHAGYSQWTETGRLNSFKPNGQNIPRMDNDIFGIRNFFVSKPGKILGFIDFSGFELRLMAWASGDETMTEAFKNGGDLHRKTASTMTGKPESEITKTERTHAKAGNFGISYGGTEHALQKTFKTDYGIRKTLAECAKVVNAVKGTYKRIPEFQQAIALKARQQGYVQTMYGYIRMLPNIGSTDRRAKSADERKAANTPIQGTAADVMKRCQNEVYELLGSGNLKGVDMIAQIHDEIVFEMDDNPETVSTAFTLIKALMEKPPLPDFPLPILADASVGYRWGEKMSLEQWMTMKCV